VGAYYIPFKHWHLGPLIVVVAFAIATVKAVLVVLYFMHVKQASRLTKVFVVTGLAWLAILMALTLNDYLTRSWLDMSRNWTEDPAESTQHPTRAGAEH
jgi:cytochrome c oxidase subunit 4